MHVESLPDVLTGCNTYKSLPGPGRGMWGIRVVLNGQFWVWRGRGADVAQARHGCSEGVDDTRDTPA